MGVGIDKARSDVKPAGIDPAIGVHLAEPPHGHDPIARDRHIGSHPRRARSVEYEAAFDDHINGRVCTILANSASSRGCEQRASKNGHRNACFHNHVLLLIISNKTL